MSHPIILIFEDKLGITAGYRSLWESMLLRNNIFADRIRLFSAWKSPTLSKLPLLVTKGNRKSPGFNPDLQIKTQVRNWFGYTVQQVNPGIIVVMDVALLGIFEPNWNNATMDNMRGGVYDWGEKRVLIMPPISVVNTQRQVKDVRAMNDGAESKDEWESFEDRDPNELYIEPYQIRSGRFIMYKDMGKLARLLKDV